MTEAADFAPIREAVRALCADFPGEYWRALDRERAYPEKFVAALTKAGFLAALIPEEYGGSGLTMSAATAIMEEIQAAGLQRRGLSRPDVHDGHGAAARQRRAEKALSAGDRARRIAPAGVRRHRADLGHRHARACAPRRCATATHYVVNGQKIWTSRAEYSDLMLLLARTTPREQAKSRTAGLTGLPRRHARGQRQRAHHPPDPHHDEPRHHRSVLREHARAGRRRSIGDEGEGFRYILSGMNAERILIGAECIGDAKWFIEKATAYAGERVVFGRPIGQNQGVQFPIARAYIDMRAAELMVREAAALYEAGKDCGAEANMAKHLAAEASWAAADMCVQTHGGFGFAEEFDIERKFRETRLYTVAPISTNLVLSYIAEHVLGLPRSY